MQIKAAVLFETPGEWHIRDVELDDPREHEVLVRIVASGLCHSDDHVALGDAKCGHLPRCGGHEGAGIVEKVGPGVVGLKVGDHIVTSFIPGCGRCRWCASGMQNLCDLGALMTIGCQLDGTFRKHVDGLDIGDSSFIGAFAEYIVSPEWCCVKIDPEIPLLSAALVGCGVPTGWGSAVVGANTRPGDVIIVMGTGGIGMNAVQGAAHAGATRVIACDPVPMKRELALKLGATDAVADIAEAGDLARSLTNGQGADATIVTLGLLESEHIGQAFSTVRKAGTVVVTAIAPTGAMNIPVSLPELVLFQKRIQGSLYGGLSPSRDIPRLLSMYQRGQLKLDELVTRTYTLDEINQGYADMRAGLNVRGVITFD